MLKIFNTQLKKCYCCFSIVGVLWEVTTLTKFEHTVIRSMLCSDTLSIWSEPSVNQRFQSNSQLLTFPNKPNMIIIVFLSFLPYYYAYHYLYHHHYHYYVFLFCPQCFLMPCNSLTGNSPGVGSRPPGCARACRPGSRTSQWVGHITAGTGWLSTTDGQTAGGSHKAFLNRSKVPHFLAQAPPMRKHRRATCWCHISPGFQSVQSRLNTEGFVLFCFVRWKGLRRYSVKGLEVYMIFFLAQGMWCEWLQNIIPKFYFLRLFALFLFSFRGIVCQKPIELNSYIK